MVRAVAESLLKGVLGTKTDEEYAAAMKDYRRNTIPSWERSVSEYNAPSRFPTDRVATNELLHEARHILRVLYALSI